MDLLAVALPILFVACCAGAYYFGKYRQATQALPLPPSTAARADSSLPPLIIALASALEDGLLVVEPDRTISFANDPVGALLGTSGTTVVGQTVMTVLRDFQADQAVERALQSGEKQSISLRLPRSGRTLRLICQPLRGVPRRGVVVLRDLTQLAHLERARREMVANVSHELRTPLASIRLLIETLAQDPPPALARRMLTQIDDELTAMTQLVDELRDLSQIESGRLKLTLRPVQLPALAVRTIDRLRPQIERRGLKVHTEWTPDLPAVMVDEDRIGQVLLNLLHNALKWTPEGGTITVCAARAAALAGQRVSPAVGQLDNGEWVQLSVVDTGIGIPATEVDRVFERFYKVDRARTRDGGGTGLGLAIAKHLVEAHGGRIWAASREGQGSTFSMLLPAA